MNSSHAHAPRPSQNADPSLTKNFQILSELAQQPENQECMDCTCKNPTWASLNLGIFVCMRCAGLHRQLGVHISKVRSISMDKWSPEQVAFIKEMGNANAALLYEAKIPPGYRKPTLDDNDEEVLQWLRVKYVHKRFYAEDSQFDRIIHRIREAKNTSKGSAETQRNTLQRRRGGAKESKVKDFENVKPVYSTERDESNSLTAASNQGPRLVVSSNDPASENLLDFATIRTEPKDMNIFENMFTSTDQIVEGFFAQKKNNMNGNHLPFSTNSNTSNAQLSQTGQLMTHHYPINTNVNPMKPSPSHLSSMVPSQVQTSPKAHLSFPAPAAVSFTQTCGLLRMDNNTNTRPVREQFFAEHQPSSLQPLPVSRVGSAPEKEIFKDLFESVKENSQSSNPTQSSESLDFQSIPDWAQADDRTRARFIFGNLFSPQKQDVQGRSLPVGSPDSNMPSTKVPSASENSPTNTIRILECLLQKASAAENSTATKQMIEENICMLEFLLRNEQMKLRRYEA